MKQKKVLLVLSLAGILALSGCDISNTNDAPQGGTTPDEQVQTISVTGVEVDKTSVDLKVTQTTTIVATVSPENASNKNVTWASSDEEVATVENGVVTAVGNGTTTITVTTADGSFTQSVTVSVTTDATGLTLSATELSVEKGSSETVTATVSPSTASNKEIDWSIDDPSIASVEGGVIEGLAKGTATVTATIHGTNISKSLALTVTEHFPISITSYEGINIVASATSAQEGDEVTVTASEVEALTYDVTHVLYNDSYASKQADGSYKFTMPGEAVAISVTATAVVAHEVTLSSTVDTDIVTLEGDVWSAKRTTQMSYILNLKNEGYEVSKVRFAGQEADLLNHETGKVEFTMPDEAVTLVIDYSGKFFSVSMKDSAVPVTSIRFDNKDLVDGKAEYGSSVHVQLNTSNDYFKVHKPVAIKIGEADEDTIAITAGGASFTMPAHEVAIELVTETITHAFALSSSEHITLEAFESIGEEPVAFSENVAYFGQKVYIKATFDASQYEIKTLKYVYDTGSLFGSNTEVNLLDGTQEEDSYFVFEMPEIKADTTLTVSVEEEAIKYEGAFFLGSFIGTDFSSVGNVTSFSSYRDFTFDKAGHFKEDSGEVTDVDDVNKTLNVDRGSTGTIPFKFYDKVVICGYGFYTESLENNFTLGIKLADGESRTDYKIYGQRFLSGGELTAIEIYHRVGDSEDFELYETVVYVKSTNTFMFGLTFDLPEGSHVTNDVDYEIKNGTDVLYSVYSDGSGAANKGLLDGVQGVYTGVDGETPLTLTLDGKGGALFNEETDARAYEISDGKVVVVEDTDETTTSYTFTLDGSNGTFTLNKVSEPKEPEEPETVAPYVGYTYRSGNYKVSGSTSYFYVVFKEGKKCDFYRKTGGSYYGKNTNVDYTVNGNIITITVDTSTLVLEYDTDQNKFYKNSASGIFTSTCGLTSSVTLSLYID